ncbi:MAG: YdcF family protein [Planctomycetes bacterium]|nr:YdcF family protein [Planctomycetota bacterium]
MVCFRFYFGRGVALFLGGFSLLNILGEILVEGFDANSWWIDFGSISSAVGWVLLVMVSLLMISFSIKPCMPKHLRGVMDGLLLFLLAVCVYNCFSFFSLLRKNLIASGCWLPFSLLVALAIVVVLCTPGKVKSERGRFKGRLVFLFTLGLCMLSFPLGQMFCFGKTDYRREADAVVVFGARAYADGTMSQALADRTRTGCEFYLDGLADKIIFSGGPGDSDVHETEAMKRAALEMGIPEDAIILDKEGLNSQMTVENTHRLFDELSCRRVLAVSHFYHLPRIKMTYQRQQCEIFTVPAKETRILIAMPKYVLREIAALWVYYLRPLAP